jgi:C1A family cysteine protease
MKKAVEMGPVITHLAASSTAFRNYGSGVIDSVSDCYEKSRNLDHAILVIGYGKTGLTDETTGEVHQVDYLIIKNSFGDHWGEAGFSKIAMRDSNPSVTY